LIDFNVNRRAILLLSVGLVAFTTLGIGLLVHALLPDLGWSGAFAIGAVVAPPDAVAATAIGRRIGLPRRIVTILEGESLLNDATALVALRTALAATVAWQQLTFDFLVTAAGGVLVGLAVFAVVGKVRKHLHEPVLDSGLSFVTPFAAYVTAEGIHVPGSTSPSGILAVVVAGLALGHEAPVLQTARSRIAERLNWRSIAFLLEGAVFLLIGLQARLIIGTIGQGGVGVGTVALVCAATLVGVIVLRLAWVFLARYLLVRPGPDPDTHQKPPWTFTAVLGWAGMRGVVTLAAAFVIPPQTPHRDVLLLAAFTVTAGTLFLQGLTLPWLARALAVPSPDPRADAIARADLLHQASLAGMAALTQLHEEDPHDVTTNLRERVERRNFAAWERIAGTEVETPSETYARRRRVMIDAERARVLEIRSSGDVPHEVVEEVLGMLDVEESMLESSEEDRARLRGLDRSAVTGGGGCSHLDAAESDVEAHTPDACEECLVEGTTWVHLRLCLTCGHVGCCDSSPRRHATGHFHRTRHPVMRSAQPGEDWRWCYVDEVTG
jgi:monovalent cation/hydrogen antiporter